MHIFVLGRNDKSWCLYTSYAAKGEYWMAGMKKMCDRWQPYINDLRVSGIPSGPFVCLICGLNGRIAIKVSRIQKKVKDNY